MKIVNIFGSHVPKFDIKTNKPKPKSEAVSKRMQRVRTNDTGVERRVKKVLRRENLQFRGNNSALPGSPDLVLTKYDIAIFVDGCFWHGCPRCYKPPKHNRDWWEAKISANRRRDRRVTRALRAQGYSVLHLWEHNNDRRMTRLICSAVKCAKI